MLTLLALALIGSIVMEAGEVDKESKQAGFKIEPPASWLQLIVWALVYALIGVVVSFIALLLPLPHTQFSIFLFGGLRDWAVYWYWYDVLSAAVISVGAFFIGLWRRSIAKLILFVLFSTIGMTLAVEAFESGTSVYETYVPVATIAIVVGVLTFYRSMIVDLFRETWGPSGPGQHTPLWLRRMHRSTRLPESLENEGDDKR